MKRKIFGISEAFNHALEWRSRGAQMINRDVCPALRATDYKCPKYVWLIEDDEDNGIQQTKPLAGGDAM